MRFALHLFRKRVTAALGVVADWALFLGIVLIGGLGSSWYMVEAGTRLTTRTIGPWSAWPAAAKVDADPYTRAHFARTGTLPLGTDAARTFVARTDSAGNRLYSSCEYLVEGRDLPANWWSIGVFTDKGALITNPAQRYAFTSDTIALQPDGTFTVSLSRDARPGNWLPTGGAVRIALVLTALDPRTTASATLTDASAAMPKITQVQCR